MFLAVVFAVCDCLNTVNYLISRIPSIARIPDGLILWSSNQSVHLKAMFVKGQYIGVTSFSMIVSLLKQEFCNHKNREVYSNSTPGLLPVYTLIQSLCQHFNPFLELDSNCLLQKV